MHSTHRRTTPCWGQQRKIVAPSQRAQSASRGAGLTTAERWAPSRHRRECQRPERLLLRCGRRGARWTSRRVHGDAIHSRNREDRGRHGRPRPRLASKGSGRQPDFPFSCQGKLLVPCCHLTVMVIRSDVTGGLWGTCLKSPRTSCKEWAPGVSSTVVSVWPPPKCR